MNQLLPLLPSGPGGVYNVSLRGDRQEIPLKYNSIDLGRRSAGLWVILVTKTSRPLDLLALY